MQPLFAGAIDTLEDRCGLGLANDRAGRGDERQCCGDVVYRQLPQSHRSGARLDYAGSGDRPDFRAHRATGTRLGRRKLRNKAGQQSQQGQQKAHRHAGQIGAWDSVVQCMQRST